MKNLISILLMFGAMLLAIPAIALFMKPSDSEKKPDSSQGGVQIFSESEYYKMLDTTTNTIIEITPRDYVIGAVFAQMPANFEKEALKAQAIIAHTYILKQHATAKNNPLPELLGADFSNNFNMYQACFTQEQVKALYGKDYDENLKKVAEAVDEVMGKVITYNGSLIMPVFHSMSGGMTESAQNAWGTDFPYLKSVKSDWETTEQGFTDKKEFTADELSSRLTVNYKDLKLGDNKSEWIKIIEQSEAGTVMSVQIGDKTIKGSDLKDILSLRSCYYDVSFKDDKFTFETKGVGHGVGFSQYGANAMARKGDTYDKLITYYYTGVQIEDIE